MAVLSRVLGLPLLAAEGGGHHEPPKSIFTDLFHKIRGTPIDEFFGFSKRYHPEHGDFLGQFWFEAICFTLLGSILLIVLALLATRRYSRVPGGIQNVFEWAVGLLRGMVHGFIPGPQGDRYLPYLGTVFLFIFTLNMLGVIPAFRSPTMTLSTTAALGITTFIMVQSFAIRDTGLFPYMKHYTAGTAFPLMLLMIPVELIGELAKPMSLSLRLYGNIFGEDNVIEQLMTLGGWIPVHVPMLFLALFTSFLQAFIFTTLSTIYIASKVVHEDHGEAHGHDDSGHGKEAHAHDAHAH